jgi:integrase/recombinase XerD
MAASTLPEPSQYSQLIQQWLTHLRAERGLSPLTIDSYGESLKAFRRWLKASAACRHADGRLSSATRGDVQRFMVAMLRNVTGRSVYLRLSALRNFYRFQVAENIIAVDPTRGIKTPRYSHKLPDWLDQVQTANLLRIAETADSVLAIRNALLLHLLYGSGLRASEVAWMCRSDLATDLSAVRIRGKGGIERLALLGRATQTLLRRYLESPDAPQGEYLFPRFYDTGRTHGQRRGDVPITRQRVWQIVSAAMKAAGLSGHPHTLRHSAASHMTCNGADVSHVQAFLGHASPETTMIYSHIDTAAQRRGFDQFHPRAHALRKGKRP